MRMEFACLLKMCFLCWIHFYISNGSWEIHLSAICQQSNITNYSRHTLLPFLRRKKNVCLLHSFNETMLSLDNNIVYEEKTTYILAQNNAYSMHTKKYFCWILQLLIYDVFKKIIYIIQFDKNVVSSNIPYIIIAI